MKNTLKANLKKIIDSNLRRKNLCTSELIEHSVRALEAVLSDQGSLVADTGSFTGRSPKDRFIADDETTKDRVYWGKVNQPVSRPHFDRLADDMLAYAADKKLYVQELYVGVDESLPVCVITERAWHNSFARNLFLRRPWEMVKDHWTVIHLPGFRSDPKRHGCRTDTMIAMDFTNLLVLIANTEYAGEIKKSLFAVMNFELPLKNILPMHCSANHDSSGVSALFFGLSGTGKTTLSSDDQNTLIGDDEHGWNDHGIFNFEGGCYAKTVNLSRQKEPLIHKASNRFGAILENVVLNAKREPQFDSICKTENTRSAYPIDFIGNASTVGRSPPPQNIFFLTADAYGVLPPVSKLSVEGAMYHFLSGYTSKLAGTERGVTDPEATFSACFGSPFLPLPPHRYAELLRAKIDRYGPDVWLINTGWQGGPYGVGERIDLLRTRAMVAAARSGALKQFETALHPIFNLEMVLECPGIPGDILKPWQSWKSKRDYDHKAQRLAQQFVENFKQFHDQLDKSVIAAGPNP